MLLLSESQQAALQKYLGQNGKTSTRLSLMIILLACFVALDTLGIIVQYTLIGHDDPNLVIALRVSVGVFTSLLGVEKAILMTTAQRKERQNGNTNTNTTG